MAKLLNNILSAYGDYKELEDIRAYVRLNAEKSGLSETKVNQITLAVDEACSNLIHYSINFDKKQKITINIENKKNKFVVTIQDKGKPFDPLSVKSPDMEKYFKEFKHGGLGIHIIKKIVDNIEYKASKSSSDFNSLILTMNL
jgi:serine/threonine-protein kinase RsbW